MVYDFNFKKCKIMNFGKKSPKKKEISEGEDLTILEKRISERDLGLKFF